MSIHNFVDPIIINGTIRIQKCNDVGLGHSHSKVPGITTVFSFIKTVNFLGWKLDNNLIRKSVGFSSFDKVKKMGKEKNQKYGNGPKNGKFKGEFTRSGVEGQFNSELKKETIDLVLKKFPKFKNLYPNLVE